MGEIEIGITDSSGFLECFSFVKDLILEKSKTCVSFKFRKRIGIDGKKLRRLGNLSVVKIFERMAALMGVLFV